MEKDTKLKTFIKTTIREFLNENINNSFKIGDFVTYKSFDEFGLPSGIKWGEIVDIDGEYASIVLGGIDLNRTNHFKPNYMKPIRIRPRKDSDVVIKSKISSLSSVDNTNWVS
jgi:hypothetical protein